MKKITFLLLLLGFTAVSVNAEFYRVKLTDKGPGEFEYGSEKYESIMTVVTDRALQRRSRNVEAGIDTQKLTEEDVPVYKAYKDTLGYLGAKICLESRWFNYVVIDCDSLTADDISNLGFVLMIENARNKATNFTGGISSISNIPKPITKVEEKKHETLSESYFLTEHQNAHIGANTLHDMGIFGQGIRIGVMDGGFLMLDTLPYHYEKIVDNRDFLSFLPGIDTAIADYDGKFHGSQVLSVMNAEVGMSFLGLATNAEYMLARTETTTEESHIELDAMVAGIEWLEAQGCDIITASLGYANMEDSYQSFSVDELDGTSIVAQAYDKAYDRCVLMINSAGNEGPDQTTVSTPSDAENVLSIGAIDEYGFVADFSSRGPLKNGKMRPHLTAFGERVATLMPFSDAIWFEDGTSFATPIVAAASALVWSSSPNLPHLTLRQKMIEKASKYESPDNNYGYGVPNIASIEANSRYSVGDLMYYVDNENDVMTCFARTRHEHENGTKQLLIKFAEQEDTVIYEMQFYNETREEDNYFSRVDIPLSKFEGKPAKAFLHVSGGFEINRKPFYNNEFITLDPNSEYIPGALDTKYIPSKYSSSIEDIAENTVKIYPNPASDLLKIQTKGLISVEIYSIEGSLMLHSQLQEIDIANLIPGVYFAKIKTVNGIEISKFVKG